MTASYLLPILNGPSSSGHYQRRVGVRLDCPAIIIERQTSMVHRMKRFLTGLDGAARSPDNEVGTGLVNGEILSHFTVARSRMPREAISFDSYPLAANIQNTGS